jgi:phage terminase large subunit
LITLNSKYSPLFTNETRFFVLTGGRGSAKSFGVGTFASLLSFESNHKILFTRKTMTSAHLSIIPEFQEKIRLIDKEQCFDITKSEITNKVSGSQIVFRGLKTSSGDQTANLKSLQGVTTWILDEAEELTDEATFDKINLSIRQKGVQNRVILILNPATKEHWIYKRFFEQEGVNEGFNGIKGNTTYIHTTYLDNEAHLDQSFLDEVRRVKETNPFKYNHVVLGGWLNKAEGVIYTDWKTGEYQEIGNTVYGQDYGFSIDPTTLVACNIDKAKKTIYVKEHLYSPNLVTSEVFEYNKLYCGLKRLIIGDSAEPRLINELRNRGLNIIGITKPKINERIALMQDWHIVVDPDSTNVIKELNNYVWSDKKSETPIDAFNHLLDPVGYVLWHFHGSNQLKTRLRSTGVSSYKDAYRQ